MRLDESTALALHKKYAPTEQLFELVFTHCKIVRDIALQLIALGKLDVAEELVVYGSLVHDVGVYRLFDANGEQVDDAYIKHGILGYELLRKEGFDESICRFASCHTGVGLTAADIESQHLPLPPGDYTPKTTEETLVMYADKFHTKTKPPTFVTAEWYLDYVGRFGKDKRSVFKHLIETCGKPDLNVLQRAYNYEILTK